MSRRLSDIRGELRQPIAVQNVSDVELLLEHFAKLWEAVDMRYEETKLSGQALVEDLTVKLSHEGTM